MLTDRGDTAEEFGRYFSSIVGVLEEGNECIDAGGQLQLMYKSKFKFSKIEEDVLKLLCSLDPNN